MKKSINWNLYLVTDAGLSRGRSHDEVVAAAIRGGVSVVQYRDKDASTRRMIETAQILQVLCRADNVPFIVNDRLDVALAVDADGIHVGQDDMPARTARRLIGPTKILGVTAGDLEEALAACADGADYIGLSPVFETATKSDTGNTLGLEAFAAIAHRCTLPVVGIAGINASNATGVIQAGASGIAVVSAIVSADDIEAAARKLIRIIEKARGVSH